MFRKYSLLFLFPLLCESLLAKSPVDCKAVTATVTQCNPYSFKFLKAKKVKYDKGRQKLIVDKTLPLPPKPTTKVISVVDMIEKYVKIDEPIRYRGEENILLGSDITEKVKEQDQSLAEETNARREALIEKIEKMQKEQELKRVEGLKLAEEVENERLEKLKAEEEKITKDVGIYVIQSGDSLSGIAAMFNMKTSELGKINNLKKDAKIKIGKKLIIPYAQERIDIITKAEYVVKEGDDIASIAQDFNLTAIEIMKFNKVKKGSKIRTGQTLRLPLPYKLAQKARKKKLIANQKVRKKKLLAKKALSRSERYKEMLRKRQANKKMLKGFGKKKLRVTATAYSSHRNQTDSTPFLAAWNNRIRPGMKIIAVSRDMLTRYGLRNGSKVKIGGLPGYYTVRDKMNKRYRKRIDIYMGVNRRKALRWGRRSVVIYY
jgi:LysM repeat protein